ncbi:hypothetical protein THII_1371 [Thioploca ingrica]|uniref:Uncharacterized protein n=1 Tax=Thioploca ingrica TaxID=40754 RepID=A0A090ACY6_9GAMM|nr:hypothetical protein THII_1371 [Thioploca ingrica]
MKRQQSYWNDVGQIKPPINTAVLCFNGVIFVGMWNGSRWYSNYFEIEPDPPPTHWRALLVSERPKLGLNK